MSLRDKTYRFYNKLLIEMVGIDWFKAAVVLAELGNTPGTQPDSLLMMVKLIDHYNLKKVVEFGSGMSTLFLEKFCVSRNISFISYEEENQWIDIPRNLLKHYSLNPNTIVKFTQLDNINMENIDFIYLDSSIKLRIDVLNSSKIDRIPFVIVDDLDHISPILSDFIIRTNRKHFYSYNGVGRTGGLQFISYLPYLSPENNFIDFLHTKLTFF